MRPKAPVAAAIYARISSDPSGERLGVQRQEADCVEEAKRRGWKVAQVYLDDDRSAYNTRKPRPEYEHLLKDIQLGIRDGVMIWRLDRLHRQPRELEEFIVLCDRHQVALATVTGDVDLATSQGRLLARAWGAFAAHESEVKGERLARASLDRAKRGIVHTPARAYGFGRGGLVIKPNEAAVIREATKRLLAGDTLRAMCRDFNRRRIPTTKGGPWSSVSLRRVLNNPRTAGLSTYHGEVVGNGNWKGIITRRQSERLRALLADPNRRQNDGSVNWYLLKGLLRCGRCGERLMPRRKQGIATYECAVRPGFRGCGRISVPAQDLEAVITERTYERLDSAEFQAALHREHITNRQWRKAKATVDIAERKLQHMARDYATGSLTRMEWMAARPSLIEKVDAARAALMTDRTEAVVGKFVGASSLLRAGWDDFAPSRRHAVVAAMVEQIVVWPAISTRPHTAAERTLIWWRGEARPRAPQGAKRGIAERRASGEYDRCSVEGCAGPHLSNGYCNVHLRRVRKSGDAGVAGRLRLAPYRGALCLADDCEQAAHSRGRCAFHYRRWRRDDPARPRCAIPECHRAAECARVCWRHYMRSRRKPRAELSG